MIVINCDGNNLTVVEKERLTSGSKKIYTVKFKFSKAWEGLGKTASFKTRNKAPIVKVLDVDDKCEIPAEILAEPAPALYVGVRGLGESGEIRTSIYAKIDQIEQGSEDGENREDPTPTLEEQLLAVVGRTLEIASLDRNAAAQSASEAAESESAVKGMLDEITPMYESVKENTETVNSQADFVGGKAEEVASNANQAAQSASNAEESAGVSSGAMSDLLRMIDNDIPLMVGGKVQIKNIPIEARFDQVEISSEEALTELTLEQVQPGDFAYITSMIEGEKTLVKSWRLVGDDPSIRENWVVDGTSYASRAAYAELANESANAAKINNHRLVVMTEEDFKGAVLEDQTFYLVYSEV